MIHQPPTIATVVTLSVIVPLYNEKESIPDLLRELSVTMEGQQLHDLFDGPFSHEIIVIDDGSIDGSRELLQKAASENPSLRVISFQKNAGKTAALAAGFMAAEGSYLCTIDADLQDDPKAIPILLQKLLEGYDLVSGRKMNRQDPPSKTIPSWFFNTVTRLVTGVPLHDINCGLKAYRRPLTENLEMHGDMHRYIPVLAAWNGFRMSEVPVPHRARRFGKTKYGITRVFSGLFDFLAVLFITRYFRRPIHFFGMAGLISFMAGFAVSLYVTAEKYLFDKPAGNRPILFLGILLLILGVQLFSTGLLGEMLSTSASRQRQFTISDSWNLTADQRKKLTA